MPTSWHNVPFTQVNTTVTEQLCCHYIWLKISSFQSRVQHMDLVCCNSWNRNYSCLHMFFHIQSSRSKYPQYLHKAQTEYSIKHHAQNHITLYIIYTLFSCTEAPRVVITRSERAVSHQCDGGGVAADTTCPTPDNDPFPGSQPTQTKNTPHTVWAHCFFRWFNH